MKFNKEEFGKTIYGVIGNLITALIIFLIAHFGNIFNFTNNNHTTSIIIWVVFLYIIVIAWTIFIWVFKKNGKEFIFKRGVRILGLAISIIATLAFILIFNINNKIEIPTYHIRIINTKDTITTIYSRGEVWLIKPTSPFDQTQYYYGYFDLSQRDTVKNVEIKPRDTVFATINFKGKKVLEQYLMIDELEMTLRFQQTDNKFLLIQGLPFDKNTLSKTYTELKTE